MNRLSYILAGTLFSILLAIATWWITEVNDSMKVTAQLQFKDRFLNGIVKEAPVDPLAPTKK